MNVPKSYFDEIYAASDDPFNFENNWYETRKYALTLASLPHPTYNRAFEPGCSIGILSAQLAQRVKQLHSWDTSERAISLAKSASLH